MGGGGPHLFNWDYQRGLYFSRKQERRRPLFGGTFGFYLPHLPFGQHGSLTCAFYKYLQLTFSRSILLFISAILTFVWRTGSVLDPPDRDPLGARAALGSRITITGVFVLSLVYLGTIVRTLRNYGSYQNSSRGFPPLGTGMGVRNEFGRAVKELKESSAKRPSARNPDAAVE